MVWSYSGQSGTFPPNLVLIRLTISEKLCFMDGRPRKDISSAFAVAQSRAKMSELDV